MMIMNVFVGVCYTIKRNKKNSDRITVLRKVQDKYDYSDILTYPVTFEDIEKFENTNKICIYVYEICDGGDIIICKAGNSKYIK